MTEAHLYATVVQPHPQQACAFQTFGDRQIAKRLQFGLPKRLPERHQFEQPAFLVGQTCQPSLNEFDQSTRRVQLPNDTPHPVIHAQRSVGACTRDQ